MRHPTRWRGWKKGKKFGHELTPESDWLPEFEFIRLAARCYSSKFGPSVSKDDTKMKKRLMEALREERKNRTHQDYYQDMYTLQIVMAHDPQNVLWNLCFSLFVIDVMVFTAHGIPIDELGDQLSVNLTLLLTAMAFKWVLNDGTPNVPYLTVMELYVVLTSSCFSSRG